MKSNTKCGQLPREVIMDNKVRLNTYSCFTDGFLKLGKSSLPEECSPERDILFRIDSAEGGAEIVFSPLTDEVFSKLTAVFDSPADYVEDSYIIEATDCVRIYYTSRLSKLYALYAIERSYTKEGLPCGIIYNSPRLETRCFRTYLPARDGIDDYLRMIDYLIAFGHNSIMIEIGGAMEYKRHPEINEGWEEYCKIASEFNGKTEWVQRSDWYPKNSFHYENGGSSFLTREEIAVIVNYCRERDFEIIPEVPSLSHTDYLLYNHPELAEIPGDRLPNNACPQNEEYYKLIFDVLDEVLEAFEPTRVNICHDEAYVFCYCPRCRGKDAGRLFAYHINRLHGYLADHNVKTMIWCDGILPIEHGGKPGFHRRFPWDGKRLVDIHGVKYEVHNFKYCSYEEYLKLIESGEEVDGLYVPPKQGSIDLIPTDIQTIDWSWSLADSSELLNSYGFYRMYGNFCAASMRKFNEQVGKSLRGISFSNWGANDFDTLQRTACFFSLAYNWLAVWGGDFDSETVGENSLAAAKCAYNFLNRSTLLHPHVKITHTTSMVYEHDYFYDGTLIIKEDYRMGEYVIEYKDGKTDTLPIYWGHNVGQRKVLWSKIKHGDSDEGFAVKYIYEPIGESCPVIYGDETYYETVLPVSDEVISVKLVAREGCEIDLKGYEVVYP